MGEDIGHFGGMFTVTQGLLHRFGDKLGLQQFLWVPTLAGQEKSPNLREREVGVLMIRVHLRAGHIVCSSSTMRSAETPPNIIAPSLPLPTGQDSKNDSAV